MRRFLVAPMGLSIPRQEFKKAAKFSHRSYYQNGSVVKLPFRVVWPQAPKSYTTRVSPQSMQQLEPQQASPDSHARTPSSLFASSTVRTRWRQQSCSPMHSLLRRGSLNGLSMERCLVKALHNPTTVSVAAEEREGLGLEATLPAEGTLGTSGDTSDNEHGTELVPARAAAGDNDPGNPDPRVPPKVKVSSSPVFLVDRKLGKGGFGQVFLGKRLRKSKRSSTPNEVALKLEHKNSADCEVGGPPKEWQMYQKLVGSYGLPKLHYKGMQGDFYVMIMDLLGPSLLDVWWNTKGVLSSKYVACVAIEALYMLKELHQKGYVHGDVKPDNFLLGTPGTEAEKKLYLVDLGMATRWRTLRGNHVKYDQEPGEFSGTVRYASVHAQLGRTPSRRDDMESLAYTLIFLLNGRLPWQGFQGDQKEFQVCKTKVSILPEELCQSCPEEFQRFTEYALSMRFEEEPEYEACAALFKPLIGRPAKRPIDVEQQAVPKVGRKRGSDKYELYYHADGQERTAARTHWPAQQWLTICSKQKQEIYQRCHHNVNARILDVHVAEGRDDGLFISSAACSGDSWAVVMDQSNNYTDQRHMITNPDHRQAPERFCMPDYWIKEQWEKNFYITALAGSSNLSTLVVTSRGTPYTEQIYYCDNTFPFEWVRDKWKEKFHVTSISAGGGEDNPQWAVVMSRPSGFTTQCIELDFQFPTEGLYSKWEAGYMITSCAATPRQVALVLSKPVRRRKLDDRQETLCTSMFPSTPVQELAESNQYVSSFTYGCT